VREREREREREEQLNDEGSTRFIRRRTLRKLAGENRKLDAQEYKEDRTM
jgi:hypothetical protein